jgi:hypothetical protein
MATKSVGLAQRAAVVLAAVAMAACHTETKIGTCGTYTDTPGTARIVSVETAPAGEYNCRNDPVRVLFDFTPTDPQAASLAASGVNLTIGAGMNPPRAWVTSSGLTVGSDHPAVRSDQPVGPCSPVVWKLTGLDYGAGLEAC